MTEPDPITRSLQHLEGPPVDVPGDLRRVHRKRRRRGLVTRGVPVVIVVILIVSVLSVTNRPDALERAGVRTLNGNVARAAVPPEDASAATTSLDAFSIDLFRRVASETPDGNVVLSPASVYLTMVMAMLGARGRTRSQMAGVLHNDASPADRRALNALEAGFVGPRPNQKVGPSDPDAPGRTLPAAHGAAVHLANSVWLQRGFAVRQRFLDQLSATFGAPAYAADFATQPEKSRRSLNSWVADHTDGKITDLVRAGQITEMTRMVLANAVTFSGRWTTPFSTHTFLDFTTADGRTVHPDPLITAGLEGATGDGWRSASIPIVGDAHLLVIKPDRPSDWPRFVRDLTPALLARADRGTERTTLTMPAFTSTTRVGLSSSLAALGMTDAFKPHQADFSGIDGGRDLYVSFVDHQAHVHVDADGIEAQAATATGFKFVSAAIPPPDALVLDHPFVYAIMDDNTDAPLFIGQVTDPTAHS